MIILDDCRIIAVPARHVSLPVALPALLLFFHQFRTDVLIQRHLHDNHRPAAVHPEDSIMKKLYMTFFAPRAVIVVATSLLALASASEPAMAAEAKLAFAAEVDSCLAAVNHQVDLKDANRVRHLVTNSKRTAVGYALTIQTSVFRTDTEKRFAVHCVARGSDKPLELRIDEIDS